MPKVRTYFEFMYKRTQAEIDEAIWRVACQSNASSLSGLEIRVVYNSFDDIRFAVAAKYFAIASAELASKGYPDFVNRIRDFPGPSASFTVISTDHRFAWGNDDARIQENRATACRGISERLGEKS